MATSTKVTREEFDALVARVTKLEKIVFAVQPQLSPTAEKEKEFGTHVLDGRKSQFL